MGCAQTLVWRRDAKPRTTTAPFTKDGPRSRTIWALSQRCLYSLEWLPLCHGSHSATIVPVPQSSPPEPAELVLENGNLGTGRCCFHREQKLRSQRSSLMKRALMLGAVRQPLAPIAVRLFAPQPSERFSRGSSFRQRNCVFVQRPWARRGRSPRLRSSPLCHHRLGLGAGSTAGAGRPRAARGSSLRLPEEVSSERIKGCVMPLEKYCLFPSFDRQNAVWMSNVFFFSLLIIHTVNPTNSPYLDSLLLAKTQLSKCIFKVNSWIYWLSGRLCSTRRLCPETLGGQHGAVSAARGSRTLPTQAACTPTLRMAPSRSTQHPAGQGAAEPCRGNALGGRHDAPCLCRMAHAELRWLHGPRLQQQPRPIPPSSLALPCSGDDEAGGRCPRNQPKRG